jgi:PAB-dependent poly(A)-specific ribonuclease subunit 2
MLMIVQTENHDSIEDARTALSLYQRALQLQAEGQFDTVLNELYAIGHSFNWK